MHTVVVRFRRHITHPYTFARPTNTPIYAYAYNTFVVNPLALILTYMKTVQGENLEDVLAFICRHQTADKTCLCTYPSEKASRHQQLLQRTTTTIFGK